MNNNEKLHKINDIIERCTTCNRRGDYLRELWLDLIQGEDFQIVVLCRGRELRMNGLRAKKLFDIARDCVEMAVDENNTQTERAKKDFEREWKTLRGQA